MSTWSKSFMLGFVWPDVMMNLAMHLVAWWMFHGMYFSEQRCSQSWKLAQFALLVTSSVVGRTLRYLYVDRVPPLECDVECESKYLLLTMLTVAAKLMLMMSLRDPRPFDMEKERELLCHARFPAGAAAGYDGRQQTRATAADTGSVSQSPRSGTSESVRLRIARPDDFPSCPDRQARKNTDSSDSLLEEEDLVSIGSTNSWRADRSRENMLGPMIIGANSNMTLATVHEVGGQAHFQEDSW
eukprot:TRINITY_DN50958_c0_g1_i1.p1 TRINITY_DN50958_c0_g1~~TRINITY_DN50958_c0_g1_i1.p1  ORF type:complete len:265 (+),score=27.90 TRINITY_DN50958_c0_g1_i1:70-795(+)